MHVVRRSTAALMSSVFALVSSCRSHGAAAPAAVGPASPAESPAKPMVAWSEEPVASARLPSGQLAGVVLDTETGARLAMVQVWRPTKSLSVVSDSAGRFRIPVPNVGDTVRFRRFGYAPYQVTVPRSDSGLIAVIALRAYPIILCHVSLGTAIYEVDSKGKAREVTPRERHPGVVVIAHDALTARAPVGGIAVSVRDGSFADSAAASADTSDRIVASAAFERPGRYEITVRSPGYRDWTGTSAARLASECGGELRPAVFHAWLIPH
jgi:hypothetical protein